MRFISFMESKFSTSEEDQIKKELAETFEKMKNDPEQKFLAEAGLGDFLKMIEDYEKS